MSPIRQTIFALLLLMIVSSPAVAQRSGPEFRRPLACEPLEPRTKLEAIDSRYERILIKGFSQVANLDVRGGEIRIDAVELKDPVAPARATGIVVAIREATESRRENRALIDYEEIDAFIRALDAVSKVNETATQLTGFEARYRTRGDLEVNVFRQNRSGMASSVATGICDRVSVFLTLDELNKFRGIILEAKTRLDEIK